jgi:hypothetical protein
MIADAGFSKGAHSLLGIAVFMDGRSSALAGGVDIRSVIHEEEHCRRSRRASVCLAEWPPDNDQGNYVFAEPRLVLGR